MREVIELQRWYECRDDKKKPPSHECEGIASPRPGTKDGESVMIVYKCDCPCHGTAHD